MGTGLTGTYLTGLTDVDSTDREGIGKIRFENGKWYKYCHFKNTTATVAGAAGLAVAYGAATGYQNNLIVADLTDADAVPFAAGVVLAAITGTLTVSYYCWLQIKGLTTLTITVTSGADGAPFHLSTTDGTCVRTVEVDSGGAIKRLMGISMDDSEKLVVLDCPF
jgi:hypothetical protein